MPEDFDNIEFRNEAFNGTVYRDNNRDAELLFSAFMLSFGVVGERNAIEHEKDLLDTAKKIGEIDFVESTLLPLLRSKSFYIDATSQMRAEKMGWLHG